MPRWLLRGLLALAATAALLGAASCWLISAPARGEAARREAALALWQRTRPTRYQLRARLLSMQGGETLQLQIEGERLVAGWSGNGSKQLTPGELAQLDAYFPVEQLFALARREEGRGGWRDALARALPRLGPWIGVPCQPREPPATRYDGGQGFPSRMLVGAARSAPTASRCAWTSCARCPDMAAGGLPLTAVQRHQR
jgi:hypothetical protein